MIRRWGWGTRETSSLRSYSCGRGGVRMQRETIYTYAAIAIIAIIGFSLYANSLHGEFIWDDDLLIRDNIYLRDIRYVPRFFTENINAGAGQFGSFYRPVLMLSLMLDYAITRLDTFGYHVTTVVWHILAALCVFWFISILFKDRLLAFITALFFVAHPVQAEDVAYITGRADSMAFVFMLLATICYIRYTNRQRTADLIGVQALFVVGLLTKETAIILPAILLLYNYISTTRPRVKALLPVSLLAVAYIILRLFIIKSSPIHTGNFSTISLRIPGFLVALTNYFRILLFPFDLYSGYGQHIFKYSDPKAITAIVLLSGIVIYLLINRKRQRLVIFSCLWFFILLAPVSNIIYPASDYMAGRYLYMASVGFFLVLAHALATGSRTRRYRVSSLLIILVILGFWGNLTVRHNLYWRSTVDFYRRTIAMNPRNSKAYNNLGNAYFMKGEYTKALDCYKRAIELDPRNEEAYNNLGATYSDVLGSKTSAIMAFKQAIRIRPGYATSYYNLALAYDDLGRKEEALETYQKAIEFRPRYQAAYHNMAVIYYEMGRYDEAIQAYDKALSVGWKGVPEFEKMLAPYREDK